MTDHVRDLILAACARLGGNDGRFNLDGFRYAAREAFDLKDCPSREWAEAAVRKSGLADTVDDGFSWKLRRVNPIWRRGPAR